ncbi:MAG TPA: DUF1553 domain-containing protein [Planctomycetaceae bacterium]|nr:DUF1553 domain-containing protein [Planctomycetaceae bacterium]
MPPRFYRVVLLLHVLLATGDFTLSRPTFGADPPTAANGTQTQEFTSDELTFFEKQVRPILQSRCLKCHGGEEKIRGGLRMTSRAAILKGGDQGAAVTLEKPTESLLIQAINYDGLEMPPSGRLPKDEVEILTRWVKSGLPWTPGTEKEADEKGHAAPVRPTIAEAKSYWAYRPLERPAVPDVKAVARVGNPIDAFLLAKLESKGLRLAPPADRVTLIRRAYYDLIGLPPKPEEVDAFVADPGADAYERLIDRLLDSPQYGEKWGRHWLDLVRFAETHGYERDSPKPFAWRYRDYVIDAFNCDRPYDQFLREQFAGDELEEVTPESLIATGFYRLGIWDDEPADRALAKYDILDGIVTTTGQVVLGMTIGCARCHDHKKDPIPQRDYYRLLAFFRDVTDMNVKNTRRIATVEERREHERQVREKHRREGELYARLYQLEQEFAAALAGKKGIKVVSRPPSDLVDLAYRFYRDTWETLPDFEGLKSEGSGTIAHNLVTLAPASRQEAIGFVFEGKLRVPEAGDCTFFYDSTAGLRLFADGKQIIDKPEHGTHRGEAHATLAQGLVPFRLEYFNAYEKPNLRLAWSGPGFGRRSLTDETAADPERVLTADSRKEAQEWKYTFSEPPRDWMLPAFSDEAWQRGPGGFGTRGTPGAVVRTVWNTRDVWMRKPFRVETVPDRIALQLHHDDECEIYLNGVLVHRAEGFTTAYQQILLGFDGALPLVAGENLIAVHCHQTTGGQYIDVGISEAPERLVLAEFMRRYGAELLGAEPHSRHVALTSELEQSRKTPVPEPGIEVMAVDERGRQETHVLIRGNPGATGEQVDAGIPVVLDRTEPTKFPGRERAPAGGRRKALADWMTSAENPLTARVMVNRLWQHHFGRGIVPTPNDFGLLGEPPTHPELLDWLASEFRDGGWRIKRMHRLIMLSNAYQMSSQGNEQGLAADPGNSLFWRFNMRRLSAEEVRDSVLAVSGRLNLKAGGPGVYPPIPKEVLAGQSVPGQGWGNSPPEEAARRSVYVHVKRSLLVPVLSNHDQADTDSSCPVRYTTTVPTQALGMLNGDFSQEQAAALAERLQRECPDDVAGQITLAVRLTTARRPLAAEVEQDVRFVGELKKQGRLSNSDALRHYCLLALNANEFIYLD